MSAQRLTRRRAPRILLEVRILALACALAAALPSLASASAPKVKAKPKLKPAAELTALNTHETFTLRPDASGHFGKKAAARLEPLFALPPHRARARRCRRGSRRSCTRPRSTSNCKPLLVVAGYRAPRIAHEEGQSASSPHKQGLACDFRVEGVANTELRDYLRAAFSTRRRRLLPELGLRAPRRAARSTSAFWIDYSGPGRARQYSRDPEGDLQGESRRRHASSPTDEPTMPPRGRSPAPGAGEPQIDLTARGERPQSRRRSHPPTP